MINITSSYNKGEYLLPQKLKEQEKKAKISFEGRRTDHNMVSELTSKEEGALYRTKTRAIEQSIQRLAQDSSTANITFLLDTVENLQFGLRKGSHLHSFIENESSISQARAKQNNNWEGLLKAAITRALKGNDSADKAKLQKRFEKLFRKLNRMPHLLKVCNGLA